MCNKLCVIGLIPYLLVFTNNYISKKKINIIDYYAPLIIFINGILFHYLYINNKYIKYYDIICNNLLFLYLNIMTNSQPYCLIFTFYIYIMFYLNQNYFNKDNFIHVFGIQMIGLQLYLEYSY